MSICLFFLLITGFSLRTSAQNDHRLCAPNCRVGAESPPGTVKVSCIDAVCQACAEVQKKEREAQKAKEEAERRRWEAEEQQRKTELEAAREQQRAELVRMQEASNVTVHLSEPVVKPSGGNPVDLPAGEKPQLNLAYDQKTGKWGFALWRDCQQLDLKLGYLGKTLVATQWAIDPVFYNAGNLSAGFGAAEDYCVVYIGPWKKDVAKSECGLDYQPGVHKAVINRRGTIVVKGKPGEEITVLRQMPFALGQLGGNCATNLYNLRTGTIAAQLPVARNYEGHAQISNINEYNMQEISTKALFSGKIKLDRGQYDYSVDAGFLAWLRQQLNPYEYDCVYAYTPYYNLKISQLGSGLGSLRANDLVLYFLGKNGAFKALVPPQNTIWTFIKS
jgi:hypothetical protein